LVRDPAFAGDDFEGAAGALTPGFSRHVAKPTGSSACGLPWTHSGRSL